MKNNNVWEEAPLKAGAEPGKKENSVEQQPGHKDVGVFF